MVKDGVADPKYGWDEIFQIQQIVAPDIPVEAAGLLCTWREVFAGFTDFNLQPDNRIIVFGAGPVGLSFVKFAKLRGFKFVGSIDPVKEKRELALKMGADEVYSPNDSNLQKLIAAQSKNIDAVIDAVGSEDIINTGISIIKNAGSVCVYGVLNKHILSLDKTAGPYNFNLLVHQWPTRKEEAAAHDPLCRLIKEGKLDYHDFVSIEYPIERISNAIDYAGEGTGIKTLLRY